MRPPDGFMRQGNRVNALEDDRAMRLRVGDFGVRPFLRWLLGGFRLGLRLVNRLWERWGHLCRVRRSRRCSRLGFYGWGLSGCLPVLFLLRLGARGSNTGEHKSKGRRRKNGDRQTSALVVIASAS